MKKTIDLADIISLAGVIISFIALIISFSVLLQLNQNAKRAKEEAELRIRPIAFVQKASLNLEEDADTIKSLSLKVSNLGLAPALNVNVKLAEDIAVPGSGTAINKDLFESSTLLQVLPNTNGNTQGSLSINVDGNDNKINLDDTQFAPKDFAANTATVIIDIKQRPDGQKSLKLSSLRIKRDELETALNDALYRTTSSTMSNNPVVFNNRPRRSESLVFGE